MSNKIHSVTLVFVGLLSVATTLVLIGLLFSAAAAKVSADALARLEQEKSNICSLIEQGNYNQAQEQTQKLLADFSNNPALPEALYGIAEKFRWFGASDRDKDKYGRAQKVYQQIIANYPDNPFAHKAALGIAKTKVLYFIVAQDFNAAGQAFNEMAAAFQNDPNLPDELYWIGRGYGYWERHQEEKDAYQRIIQNHPDNQYADRARIGFAKANVQSLIMSKDYDAAEKALDKLVADFHEHPDLPEALYWIAERYAWSDRYEEAKSVHQEIIKDFPDSPFAEGAELGFSKANVLSLMMSKEYNEAEIAFDELFTDFNSHSDFPRAVLAIVEQCYRQALPKQASDPNQAKDLYGRAAKICDRFINELPEHYLVPEAWFWTGHFYLKLGESEESIRRFQKVIDDYPQYEYVWSSQWFISECYEQMKISGALPEPNATAQMELAYQKIIENYPACPVVGHACLKLANISFGRNQPVEAAEYLEMFLETSPDDDPRVPNALYDLGRAYEQMGEIGLAAETYGEFIKADPNNPLAETVKGKIEKLAGSTSSLQKEGADK
jgi:TolA-binding protein